MSSFLAGDRTPFTYFLRHKITKMKYYGCKTSKGCKPEHLWTSYFSGSKIIKHLIKTEGVNIFEFRVARIFNSTEACREHENKFLLRMNAANNPNWYNQHNGGKNFSTVGITGKISVIKDKIQKKISLQDWPEYESKGFIKRGLSQSEQSKKDQSNRFKNRIWVNNGLEQKRIEKYSLESYIVRGYKQGRFPMDAVTKQKIADKNMGKIVSVEARKNLSKGRKGKGLGPMKEEIKKKISDTLTGITRSEETRKKMGLAKTGIISSEESKYKNSLAHIGKICINNGQMIKYINKEELQFCIDLGFMLGMGILRNRKKK